MNLQLYQLKSTRGCLCKLSPRVFQFCFDFEIGNHRAAHNRERQVTHHRERDTSPAKSGLHTTKNPKRSAGTCNTPERSQVEYHITGFSLRIPENMPKRSGKIR